MMAAGSKKGAGRGNLRHRVRSASITLLKILHIYSHKNKKVYVRLWLIEHAGYTWHTRKTRTFDKNNHAQFTAGIIGENDPGDSRS